MVFCTKHALVSFIQTMVKRDTSLIIGTIIPYILIDWVGWSDCFVKIYVEIS